MFNRRENEKANRNETQRMRTVTCGGIHKKRTLFCVNVRTVVIKYNEQKKNDMNFMKLFRLSVCIQAKMKD